MTKRFLRPGLNRTERRAALSLATIFALRMLGLFLILPVFALYAKGLPGVTPMLVGLAIGVYGLTQGLLQIPFGMLSDRIGRKPVIVGGLVLFAVGSVVAATANGIHGIILGRALQGSGAIAAAVMALAADLTREEVRTRAMAMIGISIGLSFALALVLAPVLDARLGVPGLFWLTGVLGVAGILIVSFLVPNPLHSQVHRDAEPVLGQLRGAVRNPELLRLNYGVLTLHMLMTAMFLVYPLSLQEAGVHQHDHWIVYFPVLVLSVLAMAPFVVIAEKQGRTRPVFLGAVIALALAELALWLLHQGLWPLLLGLFLFFTAFNVLEASLPSLVSRIAPAESKGTAMGVYSTSQFLGAFAGGMGGGTMHQLFGVGGVYLFCALAAGLWFLVARGMVQPRQLSNQVITLAELDAGEVATVQRALLEVPGVEEAVVVVEERAAYLKVDDKRLDWARLQAFGAARA